MSCGGYMQYVSVWRVSFWHHKTAESRSSLFSHKQTTNTQQKVELFFTFQLFIDRPQAHTTVPNNSGLNFTMPFLWQKQNFSKYAFAQKVPGWNTSEGTTNPTVTAVITWGVKDIFPAAMSNYKYTKPAVVRGHLRIARMPLRPCQV